jgi:hypothetical protein
MYYNKPIISNVFNQTNQISSPDLQQSTTVSDLQNYVNIDAPVFNNNILIKNGFALTINNELQKQAFTDDLKLIIDDTKHKTTNISFANNTTTITNNINIPNDSLTYSNISGLTNKINKFDTYDTDINKIEKDIKTLSNYDIIQNTYNSNNNNEITLLKNTDIQYNTSINNLNTVTTTNTNLINGNTNSITGNTNSINTHTTSISALENKTSNLSTSPFPGLNLATNLWFTKNSYLQFINASSYIAVPTLNLRAITSNPPGKIYFGSGSSDTQNYAYNDIERLDVQTIPTITYNISNLQTSVNNNNSNISNLQTASTGLQTSLLTNSNNISTLQTAVQANNNQISTLTSLQNNDLVNFVAIDNNFTNVGQQISTINTKLNTEGCAYRYYDSVQDTIGTVDSNNLTFTQNINLQNSFRDPSPKIVNGGIYKVDLQISLLNIVALEQIYITPFIYSGTDKVYQGITVREQSESRTYSHYGICMAPDMFKANRDYTQPLQLQVTVQLKATARSNTKIWFIFQGTIYKI